MRFVRLFIGILLGMVFVGVIGSLIYFEGLLWWGGMKLADDFMLVRRLAANEKEQYRKQCRNDEESGFVSDNKAKVHPVKSFRLRFINPTEYIVEAVCADSFKGTVEIKRDKLMGSLTKIKGSGAEVPVSGVSGGLSPVEGVVLLGNQLVAREVGLREEASVNRIVSPDDWQEAGAQAASTSCEGWGYQCCDSGTMAGSGEQELRVLDCRDNCYPACLMRPALVYFNSDPLMEPKARTIKVAAARATITFGFEIMDEDSSIAAVTLDFGDGEQYTAKNINEVVKHEYICGEGGGCNFTAKLEATDSDGLTLNQERLQTIQVVLGN